MPVATKTRKLVSYSVRRKHNQKRLASKLEKAVYAMLKAEKILFTKEKQIGRCHVDVFIEPCAVVEIQGCYWHKHSCHRPKAGWTHEDLAVQARDSDRFAYLKAQGYQVVVIWECEIERDPEWIRFLLRSLKPV